MSLETFRRMSFPTIHDPRGNLTYLEGNAHIPFEIKRIYYLHEVPGGESRGGHAHKELEQVIIAIHGSFQILLDDGWDRTLITLDRSDQGLYIPRLIWRELHHFTPGTVCLVVASQLYSEADYYRDYEAFRTAVRGAE